MAENNGIKIETRSRIAVSGDGKYSYWVEAVDGQGIPANDPRNHTVRRYDEQTKQWDGIVSNLGGWWQYAMAQQGMEIHPEPPGSMAVTTRTIEVRRYIVDVKHESIRRMDGATETTTETFEAAMRIGYVSKKPMNVVWGESWEELWLRVMECAERWHRVVRKRGRPRKDAKELFGY